MKAPILCLALALGFSFTSAVVVRADDKADQAKADKKAKDLKKAKDDLEKELKAAKKDKEIAMAQALLDKLATQVGLEVAPSKEFVHKVMAKKIPWDKATSGADDSLRGAVDQKTQKIDLKKFQTDYTKWITDWKPEPEKKPDAPAEPKK